MLDITSLNVALAILMLTLLVLFYVVTYRPSRAAYAGWWCACLALLALSTVFYLLVGTRHQVWASPLGNILTVTAAGCVWGASRSLRRRHMPWWWLAVAPLVVGPLSVLDDPAQNLWPAGAVMLAAIWIQLCLATAELWLLVGATHGTQSTDVQAYRRFLWALVAASGGAALFYLGRWVAFLAVGYDQPPFTTLFGDHVTTLILIVLLTTVAFNMSTLSDEQQKQVLRELAARDGLTQLFNRTGFLRLAQEELTRSGGRGQVLLADLDHFKRINDEHGHQAGDRSLVTFAEICQASVRANDLVGRYGGEEFVLLLPGAGRERAHEVTSLIRETLALRAQAGDVVLPTVSFGIAEVEGPLTKSIERADKALYRAKATGRDRAVHHADMA